MNTESRNAHRRRSCSRRSRALRHRDGRAWIRRLSRAFGCNYGMIWRYIGAGWLPAKPGGFAWR